MEPGRNKTDSLGRSGTYDACAHSKNDSPSCQKKEPRFKISR
jgi:hypothetical protein